MKFRSDLILKAVLAMVALAIGQAALGTTGFIAVAVVLFILDTVNVFPGGRKTN